MIAIVPCTSGAQVERRRLEFEPSGLDLREVEDVVDDREQRIATECGSSPAQSRCSGASCDVEQQAGHADHAIHGRADLVAHHREELALGEARLGRLVRPATRACAAACASSSLVLTSRAVIVSAIASARTRALLIAKLRSPTNKEPRRPAQRTTGARMLASRRPSEGRALNSNCQRSPSTSRTVRRVSAPFADARPVSNSGSVVGGVPAPRGWQRRCRVRRRPRGRW